MTKVESKSFTVTSPGGDTIILDDSSLEVERLVLFASFSDGTSAAGYYDGTPVEFTGSSTYGDSNTTHTLTHYRNISGVKTKVLEVDVTNLDIGEFSISTGTLSTPTSIKYVAYEN